MRHGVRDVIYGGIYTGKKVTLSVTKLRSNIDIVLDGYIRYLFIPITKKRSVTTWNSSIGVTSNYIYSEK